MSSDRPVSNDVVRTFSSMKNLKQYVDVELGVLIADHQVSQQSPVTVRQSSTENLSEKQLRTIIHKIVQVDITFWISSSLRATWFSFLPIAEKLRSLSPARRGSVAVVR